MMKIGMLWFDNTPNKPLADKVREAAAYYYDKYGKRPTLVMVHPSMLAIAPTDCNGIEVRTSTSILSNHLFVGHKTEE